MLTPVVNYSILYMELELYLSWERETCKIGGITNQY